MLRAMSETPPNGLEEDTPAADWHISADLFRRFLELRVSHIERKAIVRHLVTQCPECTALAARISTEDGFWLGAEGAAAFADRNYDAAFHAAFRFADHAARRIAFEHLRGCAHWSALIPLQPADRLPLILTRKDWHHWGLFRVLLDAAGRTSRRDPRAAAQATQAADIAQLALDVVGLLDPQAIGGEAAVNDMRAKAWAVVADCRLLAADLAAARRAIAEAWACSEDGTGDPLDRAQLLTTDAAYAAAVGEFETALVILDQALALYRAYDDFHLQGSTLVQMATIAGHLDPGGPDRGIALVELGLQLLNPVREPRLEFCAQHALVGFLADAGRPREALALLDRIRPLYRQFEGAGAQLQLLWLQGRIAHALEQFADAADILRQVQHELRDAPDRERDFLLATLDLAEAHVAQGEIATALRLLAAATPQPASPAPHRNAAAAWLLLHRELAARMEMGARAGALFSQLRRYYRRHWYQPAAEFAPSG
jgi:tetratricopeptide (TPR) repeat protein